MLQLAAGPLLDMPREIPAVEKEEEDAPKKTSKLLSKNLRARKAVSPVKKVEEKKCEESNAAELYIEYISAKIENIQKMQTISEQMLH